MSGEPTPSAELNERVLDLEVKLAYQDHLLAQLNELVRHTADRLLAAERELKTLREAVTDVRAGQAAPPEKPPHY